MHHHRFFSISYYIATTGTTTKTHARARRCFCFRRKATHRPHHRKNKQTKNSLAFFRVFSLSFDSHQTVLLPFGRKERKKEIFPHKTTTTTTITTTTTTTTTTREREGKKTRESERELPAFQLGLGRDTRPMCRFFRPLPLRESGTERERECERERREKKKKMREKFFC